MKGEWEMRRRFSVAAAALALSVALTVPAYAGTWKYVNDQWKYQRGTNKFASVSYTHLTLPTKLEV